MGVGRADGRVVGQGRVDTGAGGGAVAFAAEHAFERRQAEEHELALGRIAHGADAPDLALQRAERGADLDTEILDEPAPHSELVAALPAPTLVHRQLPCPWALKGVVMRVLTERLRDRKLDLMDGIKVFSERGWAQILPDPDEPLVHIYAEGQTEDDSKALEAEYREMVEEIMQTEGAGVAS